MLHHSPILFPSLIRVVVRWELGVWGVDCSIWGCCYPGLFIFILVMAAVGGFGEQINYNIIYL